MGSEVTSVPRVHPKAWHCLFPNRVEPTDTMEWAQSSHTWHLLSLAIMGILCSEFPPLTLGGSVGTP